MPLTTQSPSLTRWFADRDRIAAELIALTGCSLEVANIAAGSYLTFPNASDWGLSGSAAPVGKAYLWDDAYSALRTWTAAQDRKVAA